MKYEHYEYPCTVTKGDCLRMQVSDGWLRLSFHSAIFGCHNFPEAVDLMPSEARAFLGKLREMHLSSRWVPPVEARDGVRTVQVEDLGTGFTQSRVSFHVPAVNPDEASIFLERGCLLRWFDNLESAVNILGGHYTGCVEDQEESVLCPCQPKQSTKGSSLNTVGALGCSALSSELMVGMAFPTEPCCSLGAK